MNGLMDTPTIPGNQPQPDQNAQSTGQPVDTKALIQQLEAKIPPEMKQDYQAIVVAGMRVLFDDKTHKYFTAAIQQGQQSGNLPKRIVQGIVKLIQVVREQSQGKMKMAMAFPAAITLLCHALEYIQKTAGKTFDGATIASMVKALTAALFHSFNVGPQQLQKAVEYQRLQGQARQTPPQAPTPEQTPDAAMPSYKRGIQVVPKTGPAIVHEGERIIPASKNRFYRKRRGR